MSLCAPVIKQSALDGVTCVDVTMDTLFSEVRYFQQSSSLYAFLIDNYGRLLIHPLLPQPDSFTRDAPLVDMTSIEQDYVGNVEKLRSRMLTYLTLINSFILYAYTYLYIVAIE